MKKKLMKIVAASALLATITAVPAFATTAHDNAGSYGTITGTCSGSGNEVHITTKISKGKGTLYIGTELLHGTSGKTITKGEWHRDNSNFIEDYVDLSHWNEKLKKESGKYVMYANHRVTGKSRGVCYTKTTGTYKPFY